ncbi:MAG: calcium/sodium antiporter [Haliangiales bacterium]
MTLSIVLIIVGLLLLVGGGELLVRGASSVATLARVHPVVIGLTVVAAGTSMPELVVSIQSAIIGSPALAVGNVVGSNIFNVAAILGIAALIGPLHIQGSTIRLEWPVMFLASCQLHLLGRSGGGSAASDTGAIDRLEGGFLFISLVVFLFYILRVARRDASAAEADQFAEHSAAPLIGAGRSRRAWLMSAAAVIGGALVLVAGSTSLVRGAVELARGVGMSETVIGLTIVAAGTSLPELAASAVASWRGHNDIAVANVIGSNIFNILGILGLTAIVHPLPIAAEVLARDNWWMLGFAAALFPIIWTGRRVSRAEGGLLFAGFCAYLAVLLSTR